MEENVIQEQQTTQDTNLQQETQNNFFEGDFYQYIMGKEPDTENNEQTIDNTNVQEETKEEIDDAPATVNEAEAQQHNITDFEEWFKEPEEFNNIEEAANWYKNKFNEIKKELMNPYNPVTRKYIDNYVMSRIEEEEKSISDFKQAYMAFKNNPKEYMMQFFPEALAEFGISPVISAEEMEILIDNKLKEEFGEDYKYKWNASELIDVNSFSSRLLQRRNEMINNLEQLNNKNREILSKWNENLANGKSNIQSLTAQSEEEIIQKIKAEHKDKFVNEYGIPEDAFEDFLRSVSKRQITLEDLHRIQYFEGYMRQAYEKGLQDAKAGIYNKLNNENNAIKVKEVSNASTPQQNNFIASFLKGDMYIPNY